MSSLKMIHKKGKYELLKSEREARGHDKNWKHERKKKSERKEEDSIHPANPSSIGT